MAEHADSESSSPDTDRDFDPSAEMLIHEYDDERTLEEEENMSNDSCGNELDQLEKEGDLPLEQLLAMYGGGMHNAPGASGDTPKGATEGQGDCSEGSSEEGSTLSSSEEEILENQDLTLDKEEIARDLLVVKPEGDQDNDDSPEDASCSTARLLRSNSQPGSDASTESEEDNDYVPEQNQMEKTIQVGSSFQAVVPEGFAPYGDAPPYENEDRLLWDPTVVDEKKLEEYLREVKNQTLANSTGVAAIPTGQHVPDDEQALYLLLQCGHNIEEALRRRKMQFIQPSDPMSLWSEDECKNFETGVRLCGKDFHKVQATHVRTRSVRELVQFYYMWKKSARHDYFASKVRLEKRKYALHPGVTDYMDRFITEEEMGALPGTLPGRERSPASPMNSMMYGEAKRGVPRLRQDLDEVSSTNAGSLDFQPISSTSLTTPTEAKVDTDIVGSSASTTCVSVTGTKRGLDSDASLDRAGASGAEGSDLNGNTEASEASEPASKKLKTDSGSSGGGGSSGTQIDSAAQPPPSASPSSSSPRPVKVLDSLSVPQQQSTPPPPSIPLM